MDLSYQEKRDLLLRQNSSFSESDQNDFRGFCDRICKPPFSPSLESAEFWRSLWPHLSSENRTQLSGLPDPCLNHLEDRTRKPERAQNLLAGCRRLAQRDQHLFMQALRLFPHALCRAAEAVGPLPENLWLELGRNLSEHRLWSFPAVNTQAQLWQAVDLLAKHRELPQSILDFLETDRSREKAPLDEFLLSLDRFLVRERIEAIRFLTYGMLTGRVARSVAN